VNQVSPHGRGQEIAEKTFAELGVERLSRVCHAVGLGALAPEAARTFRILVEPWGDRAIGATPAWLSDIVDDHSPFEISVTVGGSRSEVRVLVEAQGETPTLRSQQAAGRALSRRLEQDFGADLTRLASVEDLFLPAAPQGVFALWHAVSFRSDHALDLKVYLNLQAHGRAQAPAVTQEALARLGFAAAWPALRQVGARRGFEDDELLYFSLDLSGRPEARCKVYFRHHGATAGDLEQAMGLSTRSTPGQIAAMCQALGGGSGPFTARAPVSCFSYVAGDGERPSEATVYFPITGYVRDDEEARARVSAYLGGLGAPVAAYQAAVDAFASRALTNGVGMQSYVSFRHERGVARSTVYFSPEAYTVQPPRER
jgi:DMATS type aromatic prenyltransferase